MAAVFSVRSRARTLSARSRSERACPALVNVDLAGATEFVSMPTALDGIGFDHPPGRTQRSPLWTAPNSGSATRHSSDRGADLHPSRCCSYMTTTLGGASRPIRSLDPGFLRCGYDPAARSAHDGSASNGWYGIQGDIAGWAGKATTVSRPVGHVSLRSRFSYDRYDRIRSQNICRGSTWRLMPRPGGQQPSSIFAVCSQGSTRATRGCKLAVYKVLEEKLKPDALWIDAGWYPKKTVDRQDLLGAWQPDSLARRRRAQGCAGYMRSGA